ncbi:MAG: oligosaccharide flippase family protein [Desulfuromonadaceae bacterium]
MLIKNTIKKATNTNDKKRLLSNFFSLSVFQAVNYILPLLTFPYLLRVLGPDMFGLVAFAQSFMNYFSILVDFGFGLSAVREISIHRDDPVKVTEIYSSVMAIKMIFLVISLLVLAVVVFGFDRFSNEKVLYFFSFGSVVGLALFPMWYFQGMEAMKYTTAINILSRTLFTVMIFVFVKDRSDYLLVPLISSIGSIVAAVVSLWIIRKKMQQRFVFCRMETLLYQLKESTHFFWSRVSVSAYTSSNAFVLGLLTNTTIVGYYAAAEKLYVAIQSAYSPLVQTLYPYIAKQRNIALFKKIFLTVSIVNTVGVGIGLLTADKLVYLISGQYLPESVMVFRILLIALLVVVPSVLLGYPFLAALGHKRSANYSVIIGSLFHVAVLSFCMVIGSVNLLTVSVLVVATETIVFSIRVYSVNKNNLWSIT